MRVAKIKAQSPKKKYGIGISAKIRDFAFSEVGKGGELRVLAVRQGVLFWLGGGVNVADPDY